MGLMKKAPLLGSSASVGETGPSVIEGDRSLLSHFGASSETHNVSLSVAARKSAALRRNFVARGLARQYGDQKAREEHFKDQVPRYQRQQKILEKYHRQQAKRDASDVKRSKDPERHEDSDAGDEFSENVVLVVPKRTSSAPLKPPARPTRTMSPVVPPKNATSFLRNASMRQLRENQELAPVKASDGTPRGPEQGVTSARLRHSPSETDIPRANLQPVPQPSSSSRMQLLKEDARHLPGGATPWLSAANRSSRIVLRELAITKDIMMREQLVRQLKQTVPTIDILAQDFLRSQDDHKQAQATLEAAKATSPSRMKKTGSLIGLTLTSPTRSDAEQTQNAVSEAEVAVTESKARLAELTKRMRHHVYNFEMLVTGLQQATLSVVEGILEWRQMRQRRRQLSNFQRLFRFPWRRRKISNYLLHVDDDLRTLFPSVILELLLGSKVGYNPLLLTPTLLQLLGASSTGKTFLTEREGGGTLMLMGGRSGESCIRAADLTRLKEAIASSANTSDTFPSLVKPTAPSIHHDRLRLCLEAIYQEKELEALDRQRRGEEEQRAHNTYDPFSTIKMAGGVEETLSNMMALQSPTSHLLGEKLRIRQEDTTRAAPTSSKTQSADEKDTLVEVLHLNPERLRHFLEKRAALLESVADCELRDIQRWGQTNKLQGKMLVRKNNDKRIEHHLARKIQLQYIAHRQRNAMQNNLTDFVRSVRVSVVNIQRVFRGHRVKFDYDSKRNTWLEHKRRVCAVRTIINAFRRYRRRQRHRRSMTVESIAQAQLINLLAGKLNESGDAQDAAERYRRVGEERRRQRIVLLQKHKMEQQQIERKRVAAAVRMQAVVRAHLAQAQVKILRQEKKAHMTAVSALTIQSTIRKFLNIQQGRRQRFRKDLERVNQSAVRIQSIYRGYNSRTSLLCQLDEQTRQTLIRGVTVTKLQEGDSDSDDDDENDASATSDDENACLEQENNTAMIEMPVLMQTPMEDRLPPIATSSSRPSSSRSNLMGLDDRTALRSRTPTNPVSLPPLWGREGSSSSLVSSTSSTGTGRRTSMGMTRIELRLKEAELGDKFDTPPSRRNSFMGNLRHQT